MLLNMVSSSKYFKVVMHLASVTGVVVFLYEMNVILTGMPLDAHRSDQH